MEKKENVKKVVDLSKVTFKPTLRSDAVTVDMHKELAEVIYQNAGDKATDAFAKKLYECNGKIEVGNEEVTIIKSILSGFKYYVQEAILKIIE